MVPLVLTNSHMGVFLVGELRRWGHKFTNILIQNSSIPRCTHSSALPMTGSAFLSVPWANWPRTLRMALNHSWFKSLNIDVVEESKSPDWRPHGQSVNFTFGGQESFNQGDIFPRTRPFFPETVAAKGGG